MWHELSYEEAKEADNLAKAMAAFANAPYLSEAEKLAEQKFVEYGGDLMQLCEE